MTGPGTPPGADLSEARRLLAAGFRLVRLRDYTKQPHQPEPGGE
jgi:hypothetical protein